MLVSSTYHADADIVAAVEAGADGYLLKDAPRQELLAAVRATAAGQAVLAPPVAAMYVSEATVKAWLQRIFDKLGARDRASAVAEAYRRGLLT